MVLIRHIRPCTLGALLLALVVAAGTAPGQVPLRVLAVEQVAGDDLSESVRVGDRSIRLGQVLRDGSLVVPAEQRTLLLSDSGGTLLLLQGPLELALTEGRPIRFSTFRGAVLVRTDRAEQELVVVVETPAVSLRVLSGSTWLSWLDDLLFVGYQAYEGADAPPMSMHGPDDDVYQLASGAEIAVGVERPAHVSAAAGIPPQLTSDLRALQLAGARVYQREVTQQLYRGVLSWDAYAQAPQVEEALVQKLPELRVVASQLEVGVQTASAVSGDVYRQSTVTGQRQFDRLTLPPGTSPASMRLTSEQRSADSTLARFRVQEYGAQGLGFLGLRTLSVAGIDSSGRRAVGPAGLTAAPGGAR
jgi:hypothetical protein